MDDFILFVGVVLILAYIGVAIWVICKRQTIGAASAQPQLFWEVPLSLFPLQKP